MILVTGGTGLVGSHLLYNLTENNNVVRAIYRNEATLNKVKTVFSYYTDAFETRFKKIEWVKADINTVPELLEVFKEVSYVYHCAALISFDTADFDVLKKTNIEGTANIVNLCISEQVKKLCYVSSIAAIGSSTKLPLSEETLWDSEKNHSVYALTKYGAELEVWRGTQEGLDAVIVNPGVIIGPGFWNNGSGLFFTKMYKGMRFYTTGITGYIGVNDVVKTMQHLMESSIKNERYILVESHLSFKQFLETIANALQVKSPKYKAGNILLHIACYLDGLRCFVFKQQRLMPKAVVKASTSKTTYNTSKFKTDLGLNLEPIANVITKTAQLFKRSFFSVSR